MRNTKATLILSLCFLGWYVVVRLNDVNPFSFLPSEAGRIALSNTSSARSSSAGTLLPMPILRVETLNIRVAPCEDAIWNTSVTRTFSMSGNRQLIVHSCFYEYRGLSYLDIYARISNRH